MTFDEWEQAREKASQPTSMQLNRLDAGSGGGGNGGGNDNLSVRDDELGAIGNLAYELRERLTRDGDHARQTTFNASVELTNDGMDSGKALTELHDAWSTKLKTLMEACAYISNHLDYTLVAHAKDEDDITTSMRNASGDLMTVSRIYDYIK